MTILYYGQYLDILDKSNFPIIFLFIKVLHLWSQRQASLTPTFLVSKVLPWQRAGYVSKDVWNEMDKIVDPDLLPSQQEINEKSDVVLESVQQDEDHVTDERKKLCGSDRIRTWDTFFVCITESIYPSKRKRFALHALGLEESEYDQIIAERIDAWGRNYKVVFTNDS